MDTTQILKIQNRELWRFYKGLPLGALIRGINPVIRGWAHYFRPKVASETFGQLDSWMFRRAVKFVRHRHPKKSKRWCYDQYWGRFDLSREDNWLFGDKQLGAYLLKFSHFGIQRQTLVRGRSSPDDPALKDYWEQRRTKQLNTLQKLRQNIAQNQRHVCPVCGQSLYNQESVQLHHIVPRSKGGKDIASNLVLVHLFCHQQVHYADY